MPPEPTIAPNLHRLKLVGIIALVLAGLIAAIGIAARVLDQRSLAHWTDDQSIPSVSLAALQRGGKTDFLTLPGVVQPYTRAAIYARVDGYLKKWIVDIGAHVKAGQVLALIDTPDLDQQFEQARADLATARANERLAALTARRWIALLPSNSVSQQSADEKAGDEAAKKTIVAAAQAKLSQLAAMESFKTIVAPFDGIVTARKTDVGALINAGRSSGQELFEVSDLTRVRIYVQVPQAFSAEIRPGAKATFQLPQYPGRQFDASVVTLSHALETGSRSMLVELQAANADGLLPAGAYCQVRFETAHEANAVRVPATALVPVDRGVQVAVLGADDKVMFRSVQLGRDFGDTVEIVAGILPSDRVIDSPPEALHDGEKVNVAAPHASSNKEN
ncbi:MAG TPA: efflux RND transporter periplasmic adaptor subunit [Rhizomicrobium sp.]|jgi:RND family efflux transporter MFP subunit|nr:efflux RND transporter periplasmic adaptor subunit [Rhizomicrobium sp.]